VNDYIDTRLINARVSFRFGQIIRIKYDLLNRTPGPTIGDHVQGSSATILCQRGGSIMVLCRSITVNHMEIGHDFYGVKLLFLQYRS
jgi:hypothetical protein